MKLFFRQKDDNVGLLDATGTQRFNNISRRLQTLENPLQTQAIMEEDNNDPSFILDFQINPNDTASYKDALKPRPKPKNETDEDKFAKNSMIIMNNLRSNGQFFETIIENLDNPEGNTGFQGMHKDMKVKI